MKHNEFITFNQMNRIVPIIDPRSTHEALETIDQLILAGLRIIEITLRSEEAYTVFENAISRYPDVIFGAGSVLTSQTYDKAVSLGADFTISPSLSPELVSYTKKAPTLHIPGVATPTEIQNAISFGCKLLKFYHAKNLGGANFLKDLSRIFPNVMFMPSGSIQPEHLSNYASIKSVVAVGGSWMYRSNGRSLNFQEITKTVDTSIKVMKR